MERFHGTGRKMITKAARNLGLYFSGTVEEKLATAQSLYCQHGHEMLESEDINKTLSRLKCYEKMLTSQMSTMEMGGRCSAYMAANSDAILLLVNMLLEVDIVYRYNREECCFLGRSGCILTIKPIFCLNYNCLQINESYHERQMRKLETLTGQLLTEQVIIESILLDCL
jgi:hypothetical protein